MPRAPKGVRTREQIQAWLLAQQQLPIAEQDPVFRRLRQQLRQASSTRTIPRYQDEDLDRWFRTLMRSSDGLLDPLPSVRAAQLDDMLSAVATGRAAAQSLAIKDCATAQAHTGISKINSGNASAPRKAENLTKDVLLADRAEYVDKHPHHTYRGWLKDVARRSESSQRRIQRRLAERE